VVVIALLGLVLDFIIYSIGKRYLTLAGEGHLSGAEN
jgi:hypothetical protein